MATLTKAEIAALTVEERPALVDDIYKSLQRMQEQKNHLRRARQKALTER